MQNARLSDAALHALEYYARLDAEKRTVLFERELGDQVYQELRAVFIGYGGKFRSLKRPRCIYTFPVDPTAVVETILATGEANPLAYYGTPGEVVDLMLDTIDWRCLPQPANILEPSAGAGNILLPLLARLRQEGVAVGRVVAVEINPGMVTLLKKRVAAAGETVEAVTGDFAALDFTPPALPSRFHLVLMNPPFSVEGNKDVYATHIYKAWSLLPKGEGALLSVAPIGWTFHAERGKPKPWPMPGQRVTTTQLRRLVEQYGAWIHLPENAFAASGTNTRTCLLTVSQDADLVTLPDLPDPDQERWERQMQQDREALAAMPSPLQLIQQLRTKEDEILAALNDLQTLLEQPVPVPTETPAPAPARTSWRFEQLSLL